MGVYAGLIRYPAGVYDEVTARGSYYPPNDREIQQCYLSRSWDALHPALRSFGPPSQPGAERPDGQLELFKQFKDELPAWLEDRFPILSPGGTLQVRLSDIELLPPDSDFSTRS